MSVEPTLLVARREIAVKLTDRTFLVGTLVTILLLAGSIALQIFLGGRQHSYRLAVEPPAAAMAAAVQQAAPALDDTVTVTPLPVTDEAAARAAVRDERADAWLHPGPDGWVLTTRSEPAESLQAVVEQVVRSRALEQNAAAAGTSVAALQRGAALQAAFLEGDADRATLITIVKFAFAFLFYLAAIMFGMTLAQSVVEEKQSRVVEIITTAIPVRHLLAGKVLGNTVLAVGQLVLYLGVGLVGLSFTRFGDLVPGLSAPAVWFVVFFLAGFVTLACLWAVAGSLATRTEDVQTTATPLTLGTVAVFFAALSLEGGWQAAFSYVPPVSAVLMPIRMLQGNATWWQALAALALLLVAAGLTVVVGERLYRRSLLQTGGRLGWRQAWKVEE